MTDNRAPSDISGTTQETLGFNWESWPTAGEGPRQELDDSVSEERFRHFLTAQRQRSERSGRPFCVLLVELKDRVGQSLAMDRSIAVTVFAGLRRSLRETDVLGWYRTDWVVGAVLTELGDGAAMEGDVPVDQRVKETIRRQISATADCEPQVTIYQLRPTLER